MKMSDRDIKLLAIVLLLIIIIAPIFFILRPYKTRIEEVSNHISALQERQSFLAKLNENRQFYFDSIDLLTVERTKIIADFAEGLRDENTVMFLANTERQIPFAMTGISIAEGESTTISESSVDANGEYVEGLVAKTSMTAVAFTADYEASKDFLKFILDRNKRTVVTSFSMDQDEETGKVNGELIIAHYAVSGEGRVLEDAKIPTIVHGTDRIFGEPNGAEYLERHGGANPAATE
jgi:hypothetical protein